jgi:hypothetical protein
VFPVWVRFFGFATVVLFAVTALQVFAGTAQITPLSRPLPFFAYPLFVATMVGWIFTLLKSATLART